MKKNNSHQNILGSVLRLRKKRAIFQIGKIWEGLLIKKFTKDRVG
jgi:hypothetical protein